VGDWDLDGALTPIDASIKLAIFVGTIDVCDTPLGQSIPGLCPPSPTASVAPAASASPAQRARLRVGRARASAGGSATITVTTRRALDVGSVGLSLAYDPDALEVASVESGLEGFTYHVDEGVIRTASAGLGQSLGAGDTLLSVTFQVRDGAASGRHAVALVGETLIGGSVADGRLPAAVDVRARSGWVRVR
jgi:hypothetical protein